MLNEVSFGHNNLEVYKRKVEQYLKEQKHNLVISKLRNNIQITHDELIYLENLLFEQGSLGNREQFTKAYGEQGIGRFIRSVLGLEASVAKQAFGELLVGQTLNSQQIRFIDTLLNYFTVQGVLEPERLFESPFTELNSSGIAGLFDQNTSVSIIELIEKINQK